MASVNKVILVGNVGKDPEVRYLDSGVKVATFTLATTERGFKRENNDGTVTVTPDQTYWHNIVAWRGLGDVCENYVRKGTQLYVEGKIITRTWEKDGIKNYRTEIVAENIQMLGSKPASSPSENPTNQAPVTPAQPGNDDLPF